MTSCAPSIVERYRDNILWFRPQLRKVRPFPFTANVGSGPEGDIPRRMGKAKATFEHQKLLWVGDIVPRFRGDNLRSN